MRGASGGVFVWRVTASGKVVHAVLRESLFAMLNRLFSRVLLSSSGAAAALEDATYISPPTRQHTHVALDGLTTALHGILCCTDAHVADRDLNGITVSE